MDTVPDELTRADVVVSCTGATGLVLTAEAVATAVEGRVAPDAPSTGADRGPDAQPGVGGVPPVFGSGAAQGGTSADGFAAEAEAGQEENCPLDLPSFSAGPGVSSAPAFSVLGEAAVAGMAASELEQHAAWVDNAPRPQTSGPSLLLDPAAEADVIAALAASVATVGRIPERRKPEPVAAPPRPAPVLFLLDLAMPRDIDAAAHRIGGVRLVDIESLAEASATVPDQRTPSAGPMAADVDQVRRIVADEVAAFGAALRAAHITPTVVALRTMAADVVANEIARLEGRLPGLDDKHRAEITQTVKRVVDKLLHAPTVRVKQLAAEPGGAGYADALRTLFDLDQEAVAAVSRADGADNADGVDDESENSKNRGPA